MNNSIYENTETEVLAYFAKLISEGLDPYASQFKGSFKMTALREKLCKTLKDTAGLITGWGFDMSRYKQICDVCAEKMVKEINFEVEKLFRENTKCDFYLIDFGAYEKQISSLLFNAFARMNERAKNFA